MLLGAPIAARAPGAKERVLEPSTPCAIVSWPREVDEKYGVQKDMAGDVAGRG